MVLVWSLWRELFLGHYNVYPKKGTVVEAENGLGYFSLFPWKQTYAGNEENGVQINAAYRILHNMTYLRSEAVDSEEVGLDDLDAEGRRQKPCSSCHYEQWFALDKTASVLGKVRRQGDKLTFEGPSGEFVKLFNDEVSVRDKYGLVNAIADSEHFRYNACRLAFKFVFRQDHARGDAEIEAFDACMKVFQKDSTIQTAIGALLKSKAFCKS